MKRVVLIVFTLIFCFNSNAQETSLTVKGRVIDGELPIQNVNVVVKNDTTGTYTNAKGEYSIEVNVGQTLVYSYLGMRTLEVIVQDVTTFLNMTMFPEVEQLEEVVVRRKLAKSQHDLEIDYFTNPNIMRLGFFLVEMRSINFTSRILGENELNNGPFFLQNALWGLVPGISTRGRDIYIRGMRANYNLDGIPFDDVSHISMGEIYRLAVISGTIVINTKGFANNLAKRVNKRIWENYKYFDKIYDADDVNRNLPNYLKSLYTAKNLNEAIGLYDETLVRNALNLYFFIDAHHYFLTEWQSLSMANKAFEDGRILKRKNPELLKAIAYSKDVNGYTEEANELYEEIFKLRPSYSQSYRDLANSYRANGEYIKSANMYSRYNHVVELGMLPADSSEFTQVIEKEMFNLLNSNFNELKSLPKGLKSSIKKEKFVGTRFVFEWNNSNAEFELEFKGKENLSHVWKQTLKDNPERIKRGKQLGFSSAHYIFDSKIESSLKLNLSYLGNKELSPTYMKVTIYRNYGFPNQTSNSKLYRLQLKNAPQQVLAINDI